MEKDKKELKDVQNWTQTDFWESESFKIYEDLMYKRFDKEKYDQERQGKENTNNN